MRRLLLLVLVLGAQPACLYRAGQNLTAGMLDEAIGEDRQGGVDELGRIILEKELAAELGHQLGSGLMSGATEISPEQQVALEAAIDGLLAVTAERTGEGIRRDISPALRQMVRDDIIRALSEGMRKEVAPSLEETADRVVTTAVVSLRRGIEDPEMQAALSEMIRESFYLAMREGSPQSPGIGETLEYTLNTNVLDPFEKSVGSLTDNVAGKVDEQAQRTQRTLQAIIAAIGVIAGVFMLMYVVARRQLVRAREQTTELSTDLRTLEVGLGMLDDDTRNKLMGSIEGRQAGRGLFETRPAAPKPPPTGRSDDYTRKGPPK